MDDVSAGFMGQSYGPFPSGRESVIADIPDNIEAGLGASSSSTRANCGGHRRLDLPRMYEKIMLLTAAPDCRRVKQGGSRGDE